MQHDIIGIDSAKEDILHIWMTYSKRTSMYEDISMSIADLLNESRSTNVINMINNASSFPELKETILVLQDVLAGTNHVLQPEPRGQSWVQRWAEQATASSSWFCRRPPCNSKNLQSAFIEELIDPMINAMMRVALGLECLSDQSPATAPATPTAMAPAKMGGGRRTKKNRVRRRSTRSKRKHKRRTRSRRGRRRRHTVKRARHRRS